MAESNQQDISGEIIKVKSNGDGTDTWQVRQVNETPGEKDRVIEVTFVPGGEIQSTRIISEEQN